MLGAECGRWRVRAEVTLVNVVIRGPSSIRRLGRLLRRCNDFVIKHVNVPCRGGGIGVVDITVSTPRSVVDTLSNEVNELSNVKIGAICSGGWDEPSCEEGRSQGCDGGGGCE